MKGQSHFQHGPRLDVPWPNKFKGSRVANDVDNLLFNIENYFQATRVNDKKFRLGMISAYLRDTTLLWWHKKWDNWMGELGIT